MIGIVPTPVESPPEFRGRFSRLSIRRPTESVRQQNIAVENRNLLLDAYTKLFGILSKRSDKLPLSSREIHDFDREFERCHDLYRLLRRRNVENFSNINGASFLYNQMKQHLDQPKPYDEAMHTEFDSKLKVIFGAIVMVGYCLAVFNRTII